MAHWLLGPQTYSIFAEAQILVSLKVLRALRLLEEGPWHWHQTSDDENANSAAADGDDDDGNLIRSPHSLRLSLSLEPTHPLGGGDALAPI